MSDATPTEDRQRERERERDHFNPPMTNDQTECLARVDADIKTIESIHEHMGDYEYEICGYNIALRGLRALRTVIEKHGANMDLIYPPTGDPYCLYCHAKLFPCQTITDIKKELGI